MSELSAQGMANILWAFATDGQSDAALFLALSRTVERRMGDATVHPSSLLHAVTAMQTGTRYSLIVFYRSVAAGGEEQQQQVEAEGSPPPTPTPPPPPPPPPATTKTEDDEPLPAAQLAAVRAWFKSMRREAALTGTAEGSGMPLYHAPRGQPQRALLVHAIQHVLG